jgi:TRAP-type C4-dicarboxylate transport system permease small subunit
MEQKKLGPIDYFSALMMFLIIIIITGQIIWRYIFNNSLSWTEELSRYIYAWLIFIGATLGIAENSHIRVDIFYKMFSKPTRRIMDILLYEIIIFVQVYFLVYSIQFIIKTNGTYSTAMQLPMNIAVYPSIAVGCVITIYFCIGRVIKIYKSKFDSIS